MHRRLELGVAHRQHFVDEQDVGLEVCRDREPQADVHAGRVPLDRRVEECGDAGEVHDAVQLAAISRRRMPRIAPLRKTFSRPVSSGWKPEPTSIIAEIVPASVMSPRSAR